jgi:hypothetical protein
MHRRHLCVLVERLLICKCEETKMSASILGPKSAGLPSDRREILDRSLVAHGGINGPLRKVPSPNGLANESAAVPKRVAISQGESTSVALSGADVLNLLYGQSEPAKNNFEGMFGKYGEAEYRGAANRFIDTAREFKLPIVLRQSLRFADSSAVFLPATERGGRQLAKLLDAFDRRDGKAGDGSAAMSLEGLKKLFRARGLDGNQAFMKGFVEGVKTIKGQNANLDLLVVANALVRTLGRGMKPRVTGAARAPVVSNRGQTPAAPKNPTLPSKLRPPTPVRASTSPATIHPVVEAGGKKVPVNETVAVSSRARSSSPVGSNVLRAAGKSSYAQVAERAPVSRKQNSTLRIPAKNRAPVNVNLEQTMPRPRAQAQSNDSAFNNLGPVNTRRPPDNEQQQINAKRSCHGAVNGGRSNTSDGKTQVATATASGYAVSTNRSEGLSWVTSSIRIKPKGKWLPVRDKVTLVGRATATTQAVVAKDTPISGKASVMCEWSDGYKLKAEIPPAGATPHKRDGLPALENTNGEFVVP